MTTAGPSRSTSRGHESCGEEDQREQESEEVAGVGHLAIVLRLGRQQPVQHQSGDAGDERCLGPAVQHERPTRRRSVRRWQEDSRCGHRYAGHPIQREAQEDLPLVSAVRHGTKAGPRSLRSG